MDTILAVLAASATVTFQVAAAPSQLGQCTVVLAGTGTKALSGKVTEFWRTVNTEIAKSLVQQVTADHVPISLEISPPQADLPDAVAGAVARQRCRQLLLFSHELGGGSGPSAFFGFNAVIYGVQLTADRLKMGEPLFRKNYRFALTDEVLRKFSTSEFAGQLKRDLMSTSLFAPDSPGGHAPNDQLDEASAYRLLRGSPAFTGDNAGRRLVRIVAMEEAKDRTPPGWLVEFEWQMGGSAHAATAAILRLGELKEPALFSLDGWGVLKIFYDMTIAKYKQEMARIRAKTNEITALGDLRLMFIVQSTYQGVTGGYGDLPCLLEPRSCLANYTGKAFLPEGFVGAGEKSGYRRTFYRGPAAAGAKGGLSSWAFTAVPVEPGVAGTRGFCGDATGRICSAGDGRPPAVSGGRCADPCEEVK